jgi:hypothetical protein
MAKNQSTLSNKTRMRAAGASLQRVATRYSEFIPETYQIVREEPGKKWQSDLTPTAESASQRNVYHTMNDNTDSNRSSHE